jgi:fucose permease
MAAYASSATITPICLVLVAQEFGLDLARAGSLEVSRSVLITAVLLASPWVAAHFGKARALGYASLLMGLGLLAYAFAPGYGAILLALALVGTGSGVLEGLINPLVQALAPRDSGRWLNLVNAFWSVGVLATMLGGGEWLTRGGDWRTAMIALGAVSAVTGAAFLRARAVDAADRAEAGLGAAWRRAREVLVAPGFGVFVALMLLAGAVEGAFTFWSATLVQLEFGGSARAGGVATACFAGGMIAGRFAAAVWVPQAGLPRLILVSALGGAVVSAAMPLLGSITAVGVGLALAGLCVACFWPSLQSYAAERIRGEPTEIFVLLSVAGIPGMGGVSWLLGLLADSVGLRSALWLVPPLFLALAGLMAWEQRQPIKRLPA